MKTLDDCTPYYLCQDCHDYWQTGDLAGNNDPETDKAIESGYESLPKDLVHHEDLGFHSTSTGCNCCGSRLGGNFYKYFDISSIISQE
jgi:hypothetical protein